MPPTTTGASTPAARSAASVSGTSARCEPDRIDRPTTSTSSSRAAAAISAGREPDALVDDLHAGVARRDRDLLGAVGVAVEAGLADEQPDRAARPTPRRSRAPRSRTACISGAGCAATAPTPVGARYSPNTRATRPPTRRRCRPHVRERDRRGHEVLGGRRDRAQVARARRRPRRGRAPTRHCSIASHVLALDRGIDRDDAAGLRARRERRRLGLGERR